MLKVCLINGIYFTLSETFIIINKLINAIVFQGRRIQNSEDP